MLLPILTPVPFFRASYRHAITIVHPVINGVIKLFHKPFTSPRIFPYRNDAAGTCNAKLLAIVVFIRWHFREKRKRRGSVTCILFAIVEYSGERKRMFTRFRRNKYFTYSWQLFSFLLASRNGIECNCTYEYEKYSKKRKTYGKSNLAMIFQLRIIE